MRVSGRRAQDRTLVVTAPCPLARALPELFNSWCVRGNFRQPLRATGTRNEQRTGPVRLLKAGIQSLVRRRLDGPALRLRGPAGGTPGKGNTARDRPAPR